ncbi:MAG TPA: short-chain dehydrogenase [Citreicella sp.]|jgi:NAD(P)-dependent dehydrogenase (short-subunit alcohol dehydrogenase family)|uniref:SDR family oxidoreductase n=1 Tax=Salipiger marinus TaxID=555512 RepID=UPI000E99E2C6|nr:short-chain dehydrogenase [Citreicella sp.]HBT01426.1 short-chain dehydrogenase [Citreicella sp.]|tara:strand:+ start:674 stop:1405 length:732 start_codon:yes stop_codon:yes gene_type:complete
MSDLSGLTALITGAAGGIGTAMAEGFARAGARLALVDLRDTSDLAARLGPEHRAFTLDLEDPEAIASVCAGIGTEMGIDILVNNAGHGVIFAAADPQVEVWDRTMRINLRAPWLLSAAALPYLQRSGRGRVINISSQAGVVALDEHAAYGASKAGLILLTRVQAFEWARHGVTVNAIAPTVVDTPMAVIGWSGEKGDKARAEIPVGRFAKPREIAAAALYLASEDAAMVTGETLMVDGGYTMR